MKTLLLSLVALFGLTVFAPQAEARHRDRYVRYYDHCDRPVYGYVYHRPRVRYYESYYRPRYSRSHCAPRRYYSRPRVSFHVGF